MMDRSATIPVVALLSLTCGPEPPDETTLSGTWQLRRINDMEFPASVGEGGQNLYAPELRIDDELEGELAIVIEDDDDHRWDLITRALDIHDVGASRYHISVRLLPEDLDGYGSNVDPVTLTCELDRDTLHCDRTDPDEDQIWALRRTTGDSGPVDEPLPGS